MSPFPGVWRLRTNEPDDDVGPVRESPYSGWSRGPRRTGSVSLRRASWVSLLAPRVSRTSSGVSPAGRLRLASLARVLGLLAVYVALTVWRTWPLATRLTTHVPDASFDALFPLWALAYETHALTTGPLRFPDANIYHPAPGTAFYGPTTLGTVPLFAPTFLLTGNPFLAINLTIIGAIALSALGLHLVVRRMTGSHLGGF